MPNVHLAMLCTSHRSQLDWITFGFSYSHSDRGRGVRVNYFAVIDHRTVSIDRSLVNCGWDSLSLSCCYHLVIARVVLSSRDPLLRPQSLEKMSSNPDVVGDSASTMSQIYNKLAIGSTPNKFILPPQAAPLEPNCHLIPSSINERTISTGT
jgi:hypothetical protein